MSSITSVPALSNHINYHAFISYSSADSRWVSELICKLEETFPSLKICFHERDFIPGKTIIENMVECIQSSQKIIMVLSPDFVSSRWCLFEANLSIFHDCMLHKAIVPVMLKPCLIPLHLSHLTYLDAKDEQFLDKLSQALLSNNSQVAHSTLVHYQPSFLHNGASLLSLSAINDSSADWQPAVFSSSLVPDSLKAVLGSSGIYKEVIDIINDIPSSNSLMRFACCKLSVCLLFTFVFLFFTFFYVGFVMSSAPFINVDFKPLVFLPIGILGIILIPTVCIYTLSWNCREHAKLIRQMSKRIGQANLILYTKSVLVGCSSKSELHFVYISLHQCMQTFHDTFGQDGPLAMEMWDTAIIDYASDYACCLVRKKIPCNFTDTPGHIEDGICFCQYVAIQIQNN